MSSTLNPVKALTTGEVAVMFGVDRKTVIRWAVAGLIASFLTPGGHYRFDPATIDRLTSGRLREAGLTPNTDTHRYVAGDDSRVDECDRCGDPYASHPGGGR